jgi:hypothetical protein
MAETPASMIKQVWADEASVESWNKERRRGRPSDDSLRIRLCIAQGKFQYITIKGKDLQKISEAFADDMERVLADARLYLLDGNHLQLAKDEGIWGLPVQVNSNNPAYFPSDLTTRAELEAFMTQRCLDNQNQQFDMLEMFRNKFGGREAGGDSGMAIDVDPFFGMSTDDMGSSAFLTGSNPPHVSSSSRDADSHATRQAQKNRRDAITPSFGAGRVAVSTLLQTGDASDINNWSRDAKIAYAEANRLALTASIETLLDNASIYALALLNMPTCAFKNPIYGGITVHSMRPMPHLALSMFNAGQPGLRELNEGEVEEGGDDRDFEDSDDWMSDNLNREEGTTNIQSNFYALLNMLKNTEDETLREERDFRLIASLMTGDQGIQPAFTAVANMAVMARRTRRADPYDTSRGDQTPNPTPNIRTLLWMLGKASDDQVSPLAMMLDEKTRANDLSVHKFATITKMMRILSRDDTHVFNLSWNSNDC